MGRAPVTQPTVNHTTDKREFLLFCSSEHPADLAAAVHALYYLPENYKLVVLGRASHDAEMMPWADKTIMDRIQFENYTGLSEEETTSPFLYIKTEAEEPAADSVFERALSSHAVVTEGNPEALASSILRLARHQA